jgi:hypothetical protein
VNAMQKLLLKHLDGLEKLAGATGTVDSSIK